MCAAKASSQHDSTMPIPPVSPRNINISFYLIGDDVSSAQPVVIDTKWKLEDVKRAVAGVLHVAQPLGMLVTFGFN